MSGASSSPEAVCAVVVTHNRKELLRECLDALLGQSYPVARILVVDNASTDAVQEMIAGEFPQNLHPQLEVLTLPRNVGGAGGFEAGVRRANSASGWLWLLDDDTIPQADALEQLFLARSRFADGQLPDLLASKVVWTDGSLHPMNAQWLKTAPRDEVFRAAEAGTLSMRTTTFVSLLLHLKLVHQYGFPLGSYFLGGDDVEYTARILKNELGVAVPTSVVLHKTAIKAGTLEAAPLKFYYYVRNTIWMLTRSNAFRPWEGTKLAVRSVGMIRQYLQRTRFARGSVQAVARGVWHGIFTTPHD